jgi:hypothetical protein
VLELRGVLVVDIISVNGFEFRDVVQLGIGAVLFEVQVGFVGGLLLYMF